MRWLHFPKDIAFNIGKKEAKYLPKLSLDFTQTGTIYNKSGVLQLIII